MWSNPAAGTRILSSFGVRSCRASKTSSQGSEQGAPVHVKRRHLIEISDEPWCPRTIRHAVTDYSRFVTEVSGVYKAIAPLLVEALQRTGARRILDLGSGAAGPWLGLQPLLREMGVDVAVCLSDHNPDLEAFEQIGRAHV